ncbi:hypothetical protein C5O78_01000 [Treponema phagedenis]|nr:hypothetical protein C5O78_01000 [Treponema phagedenis]
MEIRKNRKIGSKQMEYLEIKDNIVIGHYCGEMPEPKEPDIEYRIIDGCSVNIGDDVRMYADLDKGVLKPLKTLVDEKLIEVPEGKKINDEGTEFIDMTEADKVNAGLVALQADEKLEGDVIVKKTQEELYAEGVISKEEYNTYIDGLREAEYRSETDKLGLEVLRGELDKSVWLEKIAEIKKRYPKVC